MSERIEMSVGNEFNRDSDLNKLNELRYHTIYRARGSQSPTSLSTIIYINAQQCDKLKKRAVLIVNKMSTSIIIQNKRD